MAADRCRIAACALLAAAASAYTVTVSQGAFNSYILHTDDSPNIYKVEMVH